MSTTQTDHTLDGLAKLGWTLHDILGSLESGIGPRAAIEWVSDDLKDLASADPETNPRETLAFAALELRQIASRLDAVAECLPSSYPEV